MCNSCGFNPCQCTPNYNFNWMDTTNLPCNPCSTTPVCKKVIPALCTIYNGPNLTGLSLTTGINIELILSTISTIMAAQAANQATINQNILFALNDINARIIAITGVSYPNYTI